MKFQEHCEESIRLFGKPFEEVHRWLDAYAQLIDENGVIHFNAHHRKHRHHLAGANEILETMGRAAYEAAIMHIKSDLQSGGGLVEGEDLPKDEKDYIKKGFF